MCFTSWSCEQRVECLSMYVLTPNQAIILARTLVLAVVTPHTVLVLLESEAAQPNVEGVFQAGTCNTSSQSMPARPQHL
jgi:hypothetical protein